VDGIDPRLADDPLIARWIIRAMMSLLSLPGRDAAEERELLE